MGLKEAGLRGSLRNASSVLPAFFDVTVTNTNSPVTEGDVLSVDYSANNTGDVQDTQDIRLEIDSVEEDRDSNVTLGGSASTTGTLQWDTTNENATTYTATVLSNDDTDSVTVEVESAIPDSVVSRDPDDSRARFDLDVGIKISVSQDWPKIQAQISDDQETASDEELVIGDTNGTDIATVDVSGNSAGDVITIEDANLVANSDYSMFLRSSNDRDIGFDTNASPPYTSSDGNLSIVDGWAEGGTNSDMYAIDRVGNIN